MAFILPTFNIECDIYSNAGNFANPPRLTIECQLRAPAMSSFPLFQGSLSNNSPFVLLLPAGTDIRDNFSTPTNSSDWVEVPAGSGCRYQVAYVNDIAKGFPNEHRFALILKTTIGGAWPVPIP